MESFVFLASSALLCVATFFLLRDGIAAEGRIELAGFDGNGVLFGFVVFALAGWAIDPIFGICLLASLFIHDFGHVVGYRTFGHTGARLRLVPLPGCNGGDTPLTKANEVLFVSLLGPVASIAPMVLAFALAEISRPLHPGTADVLRIFAITCGAVNFVYLLPFLPFDGGRCIRVIADATHPALSPLMAAFFTAAMVAAAVRTGSPVPIVLAAIGVQSFLRHDESADAAMTSQEATTGLAAYAFALAVHFCAGWWIFSDALF